MALNDNGARSLLAILITTFSIIGITIISIIFIIVSPPGERKTSASQVFSGVLPLYGTWVGTLLAFYFAKENFEAAKDAFQTSSTSSDLESIPVSSVISTTRFFSLNEKLNANELLGDIKNELEKNNRRRLPILKESGNLKFLVYERDIDKYAGEQGNSYDNKNLKDFIDYIDSTKSDLIKPVVYIEKNISLSKADDKRRKKDGCHDIIVTENGEADSKVIGYITDRDIDQFRRTV